MTSGKVILSALDGAAIGEFRDSIKVHLFDLIFQDLTKPANAIDGTFQFMHNN
jgi:hypothetical protein